MAHVLFVHGMFMTHRCWSGWVQRFGDAGHTCHAIDWPGREGTPAELRANPPELLKTLTLNDIVESVAERVRGLPEPPWLVGHSLGGLVVQRLLDQGLGRAGVAVDAAPPQGVFAPSWSFITTNSAIFWPSSAPINPTVKWFSNAFYNTGTAEEVLAVHTTHAVPESRVAGRGGTSAHGKLSYGERAPLLLTAGGSDRTIPPVITKAIHKAHTSRCPEGTVTDLRQYEGRSHYIIGETGWEEVADDCLEWLAALR